VPLTTAQPARRQVKHDQARPPSAGDRGVTGSAGGDHGSAGAGSRRRRPSGLGCGELVARSRLVRCRRRVAKTGWVSWAQDARQAGSCSRCNRSASLWPSVRLLPDRPMLDRLHLPSRLSARRRRTRRISAPCAGPASSGTSVRSRQTAIGAHVDRNLVRSRQTAGGAQFGQQARAGRRPLPRRPGSLEQPARRVGRRAGCLSSTTQATLCGPRDWCEGDGALCQLPAPVARLGWRTVQQLLPVRNRSSLWRRRCGLARPRLSTLASRPRGAAARRRCRARGFRGRPAPSAGRSLGRLTFERWLGRNAKR
jgi:hypothetical protein